MDKVALVTGASSGIGKAICFELIKRGWTVIGVARSKERLFEMQQELLEAFIPIVCDVSKREEIIRASQDLLERGFCPSLFFLNAGISGESAVEDLKQLNLSKHEQIMQVNYFGVLAWVEFWQSHCLKQEKTNFIVTGSINAIFAPPGGSAYSASKAAIAKAFEAFSLQCEGTPLHFSVAYVGPVDTPGLKGNLPFTWPADKMGRYMVDFALSGKPSARPSKFYILLAHLLRALPAKYTKKLLAKF